MTSGQIKEAVIYTACNNKKIFQSLNIPHPTTIKAESYNNNMQEKHVNEQYRAQGTKGH
jgi:hypothetical protein